LNLIVQNGTELYIVSFKYQYLNQND
jgi:hypothetical protein